MLFFVPLCAVRAVQVEDTLLEAVRQIEARVDSAVEVLVQAGGGLTFGLQQQSGPDVRDVVFPILK